MARPSLIFDEGDDKQAMEEKITIPIKSALIPNYYQNFHCLMGACQDNCCDYGWKIEFNKKDYLTVKRATEKNKELLDLTTQGMHRLKKREHDGLFAEFRLTETGRCVFHTEEGLCQLQLECGAESLPAVCQHYPRSIVYTTAAKEYALSPSCEGVLQQLWDLPDGVTFVENPLPKVEERNAKIPQGENLLLYFTPLRNLFIDILQNRAISLTERMLCLGIVVQRLQYTDWNSFDPDNWVEQTALLIDAAAIRETAVNIEGNRDMYLSQNLKVLDCIPEAGKNWIKEIHDALEVKHQTIRTFTGDSRAGSNTEFRTMYSREAYANALVQFQATFSDREYFFENLMVASALYLCFPNLDSRAKLWESYVSLCNLYSFYRFVSVLGCKNETTKERLFHMIVMASRATLHDSQRFNNFQKELFQHESSTLAHMAILLYWD